MNALMPTSTGMTSLRKEMDRLFSRFWDGDWKDFPVAGEWNPVLDLLENKDSVICKLEVPGLEPKDIHIVLQDDILTVRGEKEMAKEEKDETYYRNERQYGSFVRMFRLPVSVDGSKVNATFKNGVLTITLPKVPAAKGTEIPIKAA